MESVLACRQGRKNERLYYRNKKQKQRQSVAVDSIRAEAGVVWRTEKGYLDIQAHKRQGNDNHGRCRSNKGRKE